MKKTFRNALVSTFALTMLACAGTAISAVNASADETTSESTEVTFSAPTLTMLEGAAVRNVSTDKTQNGIRFTAKMTSEAYTAAESNANYDVKYGIAIIPKDYHETEKFAITAENLFGANAVYTTEMSAKDAIAADKRVMVIGESDTLTLEKDVYVLKVSMIDIIESNVLREFIGTPYVAYKAKSATEYTYELGGYYNGDIANNTRSMTYVAQRAIADGKDNSSNTLYNTYVKAAVEANKTYSYTVNRYFADGYGGYVEDPDYASSGEGTIGSAIDTAYTGTRYMGAYELNTEKSTKDPVVYANGKQVVELYYDIKADISGSHIHGFGSTLGKDGYYETNKPENLTDGDTSTYFWSSSSPTKTSFIVADLGQVQAVSTITVTYGHETNNVYTNAAVSYSTDGKTYVALGNIGSGYADQTLNFEQVSARYIRLACNDNDGQWVKIAEISASAVPTEIEIDETSRAKYASGATAVDTSALTYNLVYSDGSKTVADSSKVTLDDLEVKPGKQKVSLSYTDGDITLEATQEVGVWYVIANSTDWQLMNTYLDGYFMLESDLNLSEASISPIGTIPLYKIADGNEIDITNDSTTSDIQLGVPFTGKFDGQGYVIKNLKLAYSDDAWQATSYAVVPFAFIGENGYVGNFTLTGANVKCGQDASFIAGLNLGTIENIVINSDCTLYSNYSRGACVASANNGTIKNIVSHVAVYTNLASAELSLDSIARLTGENSVIENCFVDEENHLDVLNAYTSENGIGWIYVENYGMFFGNSAFKMSLGLSNNGEMDVNGTITWYTAQTEPTTYGIYGYAFGTTNNAAGTAYEGKDPDYIFTTLEKNNGVYVLGLSEKGKVLLSTNGTYNVRFRLSDSATMMQAYHNLIITGNVEAEEPDVISVSITSGNLPDIYQGSLQNVIDGDQSTYVWFGGTSQSGETPSYIQLDLKKDTEITNVQLLMTKDTSPEDKFDKIALQYSTDGATWTDFETGATYTDSEILVTLTNAVTARYVRAVETEADGSNWVVVREFAVNVTTTAE